MADLSPQAFQDLTNVSRETLDKLHLFSETLEQWSKKTNLISPTTRNELWQRHILDSWQLIAHLPSLSARIIDIGSGAGFPGLVLSICGATEVTLVESNGKKCAFLNHIVGLCDLKTRVVCDRIENIHAPAFDVITSRAVASLADLLEISSHIGNTDSLYLFLKGENVKTELTEAKRRWVFAESMTQSMTSNTGTILNIQGARRVSSEAKK